MIGGNGLRQKSTEVKIEEILVKKMIIIIENASDPLWIDGLNYYKATEFKMTIYII